MANKMTAAGLAFIAMALSAPPASAEKVDFAWLSVAPKIGYLFLSKGELEKNYHTKISNRHGVIAKGHVDIGGDKWALELAPVYAFEACKAPVDNFHALGGEAAIAYRFGKTNIYPHIGLGFHGTYLFKNDNIKSGLEMLGRVPLGLTWYFMKYLGLTLEAGFLFGATGIHFKPDPDDPAISNVAEHMEYAFTLGFDLLVGLRFP